jgi:hypothetical protein
MHPFPSLSDLSVFEGRTLNYVMLLAHSTQFDFDGMSIVSELDVEQTEPDGSRWDYDCVASKAGPILLHRLVNQKVLTVSRDDYRLTLAFENGAQLAILSDASRFEAGQLYIGERLIVF